MRRVALLVTLGPSTSSSSHQRSSGGSPYRGPNRACWNAEDDDGRCTVTGATPMSYVLEVVRSVDCGMSRRIIREEFMMACSWRRVKRIEGEVVGRGVWASWLDNTSPRSSCSVDGRDPSIEYDAYEKMAQYIRPASVVYCLGDLRKESLKLVVAP